MCPYDSAFVWFSVLYFLSPHGQTVLSSRGEGGSVKRVHKGQHLNGLRDIVYYCNTPDQNVINSVALLGEESLLFILT